MPENSARLTVLLTPEEAKRLDAYCEEFGHKKSTLVRRLIRDHLDASDRLQRAQDRKRRG